MSSTLSAPRILLVEDEMLVSGMLQGMLDTLGYLVAGPTGNIADALAALDRERIDAVVLDINLEGEMSYPIADELTRRGIPFVFSTGYGADSLQESYRGVQLLKKPFRRQALGDALTDLLQVIPQARTG